MPAFSVQSRPVEVLHRRNLGWQLTRLSCAVGNDLSKHIGWVGDHTAKESRMEVSLGTINTQFKINHAAQTIGYGWHVFGNHAGIRVEDHVASQQFLVVVNERIQAWRTNLLFTFQQKLDIQR